MPAGDARVLESAGLATDESALTGEPVSVAKGPRAVAPDAPLAERSSMLFDGTAVVTGSGSAVVTAVGERSELGRLGKLVEQAKEPATPLQRAMSELARATLALSIAVSVLVPLLGVLQGQPLRQMLLAGLALAYATVPEELPILVTMLVAAGGVRLSRRHVLLRRTRAAEAIGGITVVLTDKTGTLTENRQRLERVVGDRLRVCGAAVAALGGEDSRDPLDVAFAVAAGAPPPAGEVVGRFPFDPLRKRESAAWRQDGEVRVCVKGAPERVLEACRLTPAERADGDRWAAELAAGGLRVVAVAERTTATPPVEAADAERELELIGLAGFADRLRAGVPEALATLAGAGVRTLMVTGDHPSTAAAVAHAAGLETPDVLLGGAPLAAMADAELAPHLRRELVVARATPADKLRLVRILQAGGDSVAVTGDGVNDAPALSAADVGVAMGRRGTELAREAADVVLTDDAYPTVVTAVEGGRGITSQLRRVVAFYIGAKIALAATIAIALAAGLPSPFSPALIVLLEMFMDLGASVAFTAEPTSSSVMRRGPRSPAARFLDRAERTAIALTGLAMTVAAVPAYLIVEARAGADAGTAAAVVAWLAGHAAVAWTLRMSPRLSLRANPAFPAWAAAATATGLVVAFTGGALDLANLVIALAAAGAGVLVAVIGRRALSLSRQL